MAYCFSIRSKKNFFKAVSNALKFNDKNLGFLIKLDLWLLAVYYEFEVNRSPFKARTIFHTALQVNGKDMVIDLLRTFGKLIFYLRSNF